MEDRLALRLIEKARSIESTLLLVDTTRRAMSGSAQQYEEVIGGRTVRIEVSPVTGTPLRWRAQLQRAAGGPSAMMPFYGQTPDEAVQSLSRWLALVYATAITTS